MRLAFIIITLFMSNVGVASPDVAEEIKQNVLDNYKYLQEENIDKAMSTRIHSQSPSFLSTKTILSQLFGNFRLSYDLVSFKFIANDGDLAYVRVKQATKKISGLAFRNNEIDMVQIFRKESGVWKLWAQANIGIKYLN